MEIAFLQDPQRRGCGAMAQTNDGEFQCGLYLHHRKTLLTLNTLAIGVRRIPFAPPLSIPGLSPPASKTALELAIVGLSHRATSSNAYGQSIQGEQGFSMMEMNHLAYFCIPSSGRIFDRRS
jgi:hypothetical protein